VENNLVFHFDETEKNLSRAYYSKAGNNNFFPVKMFSCGLSSFEVTEY
jgi:hypothetical protein